MRERGVRSNRLWRYLPDGEEDQAEPGRSVPRSLAQCDACARGALPPRRRRPLSGPAPGRLRSPPRGAGAPTAQVPAEVRADRRQALAIRWIISSARGRNENTMVERLNHGVL